MAINYEQILKGLNVYPENSAVFNIDLTPGLKEPAEQILKHIVDLQEKLKTNPTNLQLQQALLQEEKGFNDLSPIIAAHVARGLKRYAETGTTVLPPPPPPPPKPPKDSIDDTIRKALPPGTDLGTQLPVELPDSVKKLLPEDEVDPFQDVAAQEQAQADYARNRFLEERKMEQQLFDEASKKEQEEREAARKTFLEESEAALPATVQQYQELFTPALEKSLKRSRDVLGGGGIGAGGFEHSGALQELAKRSSQELTDQATQAALGQLFGARQKYGELGLQAAEVPSLFRRQGLGRQLGGRDIFGQLGLESAQIPSIYRRGAFQRGLESRDIEGERAFDRQLAELGASAQRSSARQGRRSSLFGDVLDFAASAIPYVGPAYRALKPRSTAGV